MKKQIPIIIGLVAVSIAMIVAAAFYGKRDQFEYTAHKKDVIFTLDGKEYTLGDITYYIARQEYQIEEQAQVYDAKDTNKYWALHINGEFIRLTGKDTALQSAIHDMLFYEMAKEKQITLNDEEKRYAKDSASDLSYDLTDEQKERAGLSDKEIKKMTEKAAVAEKYQEIYAKEQERNYGAYDYNGKGYKDLLEEHDLKIEEKLWEKVSFGNVALNHRFEE